MKIEKITKVGYYYKIKLSDDQTIKFHESIIIKYKWFRKNIEIDEIILKKALLDNEFYLALDKGISYLKRPHSKKEVILYLNKTYEKELVYDVINKLAELNLIDDYKYALYFNEISIKKNHGINKIKNALFVAGITDEIVNKVLENFDYNTEMANCEKVLIKYLPNLKKESRKQAYIKARNYLLNHGFSNDIITMVIEKNKEKVDNISDEAKLLLKHFSKLVKKYDIKNKNEKNKVIKNLQNKGFSLSEILKLCEGGYEDD